MIFNNQFSLTEDGNYYLTNHKNLSNYRMLMIYGYSVSVNELSKKLIYITQDEAKIDNERFKFPEIKAILTKYDSYLNEIVDEKIVSLERKIPFFTTINTDLTLSKFVLSLNPTLTQEMTEIVSAKVLLRTKREGINIVKWTIIQRKLQQDIQVIKNINKNSTTAEEQVLLFLFHEELILTKNLNHILDNISPLLRSQISRLKRKYI